MHRTISFFSHPHSFALGFSGGPHCPLFLGAAAPDCSRILKSFTSPLVKTTKISYFCRGVALE